MQKKDFHPKVSIVIPVYNGSNYLREAIDSALSQTYDNVEVIVVNDGSNDNGKTDEICKSYGDKIRYFVKENGGVATALNKGIEEMKGEYFSWLSHDDVYYPNKVEEQVEYLEALSEKFRKKTIIYSNYQVIDTNGENIIIRHFEESHPLEKLNSPYYPILNGLIHGCSLLIPVKCFLNTGFFDLSLRTTQDYALWFDMFPKYKIVFLPQISIKSRYHEDQGSKKISVAQTEAENLWIDFDKRLEDKDKIFIGDSLKGFYTNTLKVVKDAGYSVAEKHFKKKLNLIIGKKDYDKDFKEASHPDIVEGMVSVIVPCYNQGKYIEKTIQSVLDQSYQNYEIIIINDGSTDTYTNKLLDNYVCENTRVYKIKNIGLANARNYAFKVSRGEFIQFLDSDDWVGRDKFEKQIKEFNIDPRLKVSYSNCKYYWEKKKRFSSPIIKAALSDNPFEDFVYKWQRGISIPIHTAIFRRDIWSSDEVPFVNNFKAIEDWIMWVTISKRNIKFKFLNEILCIYRVQGKNMTSNTSFILYWVARAISYIATNLIETEDLTRFNLEQEKYLQHLINCYYNLPKEPLNNVIATRNKPSKFYSEGSLLRDFYRRVVPLSFREKLLNTIKRISNLMN